LKYKCVECTFVTLSEEEFNDHIQRHSCEHQTVTSWGESVFCTDCGKNMF
jgi:hypothetical protein